MRKRGPDSKQCDQRNQPKRGTRNWFQEIGWELRGWGWRGRWLFCLCGRI